MGITSDMWSLRPEDFKQICGCVPPIDEQTAIARFLDYADRRIRRYIRAKEKTDRAAGGAEAGHHPPGRHGPDRCPYRPALPGLQGFRCGVAGGGAGALVVPIESLTLVGPRVQDDFVDAVTGSTSPYIPVSADGIRLIQVETSESAHIGRRDSATLP